MAAATDTVGQALPETKRGDAAAVRTWLDSLSDATARRVEGTRLLSVAASHLRHEVVQLLLQYGADVRVAESPCEGPRCASLVVAAVYQAGIPEPAEGDTLKTLRLLLDAGAEVDVRFSARLECPLFYVCRSRRVALTLSGSERLAIMKLFVDHGADVFTRNGKGATIWDASSGINVNTKKELLGLLPADLNAVRDKRDGSTLLFCVRRAADAKMMIDRGLDVNARDNRGRTALHAAAQRAREEVLGSLLHSGADVDAADSEGNRPIDLALSPRTTSPFELHDMACCLMRLMDAGADVLGDSKRRRAVAEAFGDCCFTFERGGWNGGRDLPEQYAYSRLFSWCCGDAPSSVALRPCTAFWRLMLDPGDNREDADFDIDIDPTDKFLNGFRQRTERGKLWRPKPPLSLFDDDDDDDDDDGDDKKALATAFAVGVPAAAAVDEAKLTLAQIRSQRLQPLKDNAWEKRKHLVCCYVMTRRARRGEAAAGGTKKDADGR